MNMTRISTVAIVAGLLTALSAPAMADQAEQDLYDDCFEKAKVVGFTDGEANRMCTKMVAETSSSDNDVRRVQSFQIVSPQPSPKVSFKSIRAR